jgi:hypothetical protein
MNKKSKAIFIEAIKGMEHEELDEFRTSIVEAIIAMGRGAFIHWLSAVVNAGIHVPKIDGKK